MNREIIFKREEYKEKYNGLMQSFLLEYEDYEEIDFIKSEILLYEKYKSINFSLRTSNHFAGRTLSEGYNFILNGMEKQIRDKIHSIDNEFNEQLFKNVTLSFTKIIEYLELQKGNPNQSKNNSKASLTISEIALKCFYEGTIITRENAKNNLIGTGHTSGEKLYLESCKWSNRTDRKSDPETKVRLNNKIKIFEKVIAELPENKKEIAKDELQILYSFMHKYQ